MRILRTDVGQEGAAAHASDDFFRTHSHMAGGAPGVRTNRRPAILARRRTAHHRTLAVVDLRFLARRRRDDDARCGRGRPARQADEAAHARVAGGEAGLVHQVLVDRRRVASQGQGHHDALAIRLARTRLLCASGANRWTPPRRKLPVLPGGRWTPPRKWPLSPTLRLGGHAPRTARPAARELVSKRRWNLGHPLNGVSIRRGRHEPHTQNVCPDCSVVTCRNGGIAPHRRQHDRPIASVAPEADGPTADFLSGVASLYIQRPEAALTGRGCGNAIPARLRRGGRAKGGSSWRTLRADGIHSRSLSTLRA